MNDRLVRPWPAAAPSHTVGDIYPTLLATIGDVAHPAWRARAVGVYRAALTAASGVVVAVRMYEPTGPPGVARQAGLP